MEEVLTKVQLAEARHRLTRVATNNFNNINAKSDFGRFRKDFVKEIDEELEKGILLDEIIAMLESDTDPRMDEILRDAVPALAPCEQSPLDSELLSLSSYSQASLNNLTANSALLERFMLSHKQQQQPPQQQYRKSLESLSLKNSALNSLVLQQEDDELQPYPKPNAEAKHIAVGFDGSISSLKAINFVFMTLLADGDSLTIISALPGYKHNNQMNQIDHSIKLLNKSPKQAGKSDDYKSANFADLIQAKTKSECTLPRKDHIDIKALYHEEVSSPDKIFKARQAATEIRQLLSALRSTMSISVHTTIKIVWGKCEKAILKACAKENFDYVVLGSRESKTLKSVFLGSVSSRVCKKSPIPVIIYRD